MISDSRLLLAEEESGVLVDNRVPAQGNLECPFNLLFVSRPSPTWKTGSDTA